MRFKRLVTAILIRLMAWNDQGECVVCKRNDILINLLNKWGMSPEEYLVFMTEKGS